MCEREREWFGLTKVCVHVFCLSSLSYQEIRGYNV